MSNKPTDYLELEWIFDSEGPEFIAGYKSYLELGHIKPTIRSLNYCTPEMKRGWFTAKADQLGIPCRLERQHTETSEQGTSPPDDQSFDAPIILSFELHRPGQRRM